MIKGAKLTENETASSVGTEYCRGKLALADPKLLLTQAQAIFPSVFFKQAIYGGDEMIARKWSMYMSEHKYGM